MNKNSIEKRIILIEKQLGLNREGDDISGTSFTRVFKPYPQKGTEWCLAIGLFHTAKAFFYGPTIINVIEQAEKAIAEKRQELFSSNLTLLKP